MPSPSNVDTVYVSAPSSNRKINLCIPKKECKKTLDNKVITCLPPSACDKTWDFATSPSVYFI